MKSEDRGGGVNPAAGVQLPEEPARAQQGAHERVRAGLGRRHDAGGQFEAGVVWLITRGLRQVRAQEEQREAADVLGCYS